MGAISRTGSLEPALPNSTARLLLVLLLISHLGSLLSLLVFRELQRPVPCSTGVIAAAAAAVAVSGVPKQDLVESRVAQSEVRTRWICIAADKIFL